MGLPLGVKCSEGLRVGVLSGGGCLAVSRAAR